MGGEWSKIYHNLEIVSKHDRDADLSPPSEVILGLDIWVDDGVLCSKQRERERERPTQTFAYCTTSSKQERSTVLEY